MNNIISNIWLSAAIITFPVLSLGCSGSDSSDAIDSAIEEDMLETPSYVRLKINPIGGSLGSVFNDINNIQLPAAEALGIKPISGPKDAWRVSKPIVKIDDCDEYYVEELTHSVPYLVPEAADLLKDIGRRFNDSLAVRGGGDYKIKVTSVLRTEGAVSKLRRRNINATANSAHRYGTTFDISYIRFYSDSLTVPQHAGRFKKSVRRSS